MTMDKTPYSRGPREPIKAKSCPPPGSRVPQSSSGLNLRHIVMMNYAMHRFSEAKRSLDELKYQVKVLLEGQMKMAVEDRHAQPSVMTVTEHGSQEDKDNVQAKQQPEKNEHPKF